MSERQQTAALMMDALQSTQSEVTLHVYSIPYLTAIAKAVRLLGFHVGVEVGRREYSYGKDGMFTIRPKCYSQRKGEFRKENKSLQNSVRLGCTPLDRAGIIQVVRELKRDWTPGTYNVLTRNCQGFAAAFCHKLGLNANSILAQYCSFTEESYAESYASLMASWVSYSLLPQRQCINLKPCCIETDECHDEHVAPLVVKDARNVMMFELDAEGRLNLTRWDDSSSDSFSSQRDTDCDPYHGDNTSHLRSN